jgi:hypothetical protein
VNEHATVRRLYRKLLALYPRGFKEQLGESMEQTFNDLHRERQAERGLFGFVLWTFIETGIGILQEHVLLITEMNLMNTTLANLKSSAILSFLIILPFILLEFTFVIIKRLTFDLRDALDSLVTFGFLWLGVGQSPHPDAARAKSTSGELCVANPAWAGNTLLTNPTSAASSVFLALPFLILSSLASHRAALCTPA